MERFVRRALDVNTRSGRMFTFGGMPLAAGLITLVTGWLLPVSVWTGILVSLSLAANPNRRGGIKMAVPVKDTARQDGPQGWWNRRRRLGSYAALSVLLMFAFVFTRSAVTDTWGGGDLLLAGFALIPLFVIFRSPPRTRTAVKQSQ